MRLKRGGNSMIECLVALVIMSVGLLGLTEIGVQRLQHISTAQGLVTLISAASDAAVLAHAGATRPNRSSQAVPYLVRLEPGTSRPLDHMVVTGSHLPHTRGTVAIRLPIYFAAELP